MTRRDDLVPPHPGPELKAQRERILGAAAQVIADRIPATSTTSAGAMARLASAHSRLVEMGAANTAWREARQQRKLATPIHIITVAARRRTICGAETSKVPYGLGTPEHLARWRAAGQVLCADCEAGLPEGRST